MSGVEPEGIVAGLRASLQPGRWRAVFVCSGTLLTCVALGSTLWRKFRSSQDEPGQRKESVFRSFVFSLWFFFFFLSLLCVFMFCIMEGDRFFRSPTGRGSIDLVLSSADREVLGVGTQMQEMHASPLRGGRTADTHNLEIASWFRLASSH